MELSYRTYELQFKHPFGVSSNVRTHTVSVFLQLIEEGMCGYGEACLPAYLGEDPDMVCYFFESLRNKLHFLTAKGDPEPIMAMADETFQGHNAAKAALNIALNDLKGKLTGRSYREMKGLPEAKPVSTSHTIGIDPDEEKLRQKIWEAKDFQILKIKLGTADDKGLLQRIRKITDKPLYVDVNRGWTDPSFVSYMIGLMRDMNVLLVEQPMPVEMDAEMRDVMKRSSLPLIADESVKRWSDLSRLEGVFSGINIKLMKSTGPDEALRMIETAKRAGMKIMLGCMAESSCAASAMSHLLPFADYVDLDSPELISNDPFRGIAFGQGKVIPPSGVGMGIELRKGSGLTFETESDRT